jgi:diguanylate cyclase (GGDEF)-like protein/PAS domain S-box-containing protein
VGWNSWLIGIPFVIMGLGAMWLAGAAWKNSRSPGALNFALLMMAVTIWLVAASLKEFSPDLSQKVFWLKLQFIGVSWTATLWLVFTIDFAFPLNTFVQKWGWWLWIIPMVTMLFGLTNDLHHWVWTNVKLDLDGRSLWYTHGPWFWFFVIYSYGLILAGAVVLIVGSQRFLAYHRRQVATLLIGLLLPWASNAGFLLGWSPHPGLDLTPYAFVFTGVIYAWGLFRLGLFDPIPIARDAILEYLGEGYLVLDARDRVVDSNHFARELLELETLPLQNLTAEVAFARWPALLDLLKNNRFNKTELISDPEKPLYVEASLSPWYARSRKLVGRILILYDVTQRKMVEEQLRESEELYRLLVNSSPVGIAMSDEKGILTYGSPKMAEIYGEPAGSVLGRSIIDFVAPEDRAKAVERIRKIQQENTGLTAQEYRLVRIDGSKFWGEVISSPISDRDGNPRGLLTLTRDVSERKELELRVQRNYEQQGFINDLLQILYRPQDLTNAINQVLERTGQFAGASRVYICEDSPDGLEATIVQEWCTEGVLPRSHEGLLVRYTEIPSLRLQLDRRGMVLSSMDVTTPDDLMSFLNVWNIRSLVAFPIYGSEDRLYGFIGFDECSGKHYWREEDLAILGNVGRLVSGVVAQRQIEEAERRETALVEALRDTASALNSTLNLDEVFERVLINLGRVVPHDAASIAMIDDEQTVRFVSWRGFDEVGSGWMANNRIRLEERMSYVTMRETGEPIFISDTWSDRRWKYYSEFSWVRSYAGVPIKIKGKVAGFISLDSKQPDFFTPSFSSRLVAFSDQAAIAIENARLYDETRRRADEMAIINRIGLTLTAGLEMSQVLVSLFEQCRQVLPVDVFSVAMYEPESGMIDYPLFYNDGEFQVIEPRNIQTHPSMSGEVITRRRTIYLPDLLTPEAEKQHSVIRLGGKPTRSYVGVPLIVIDRVVGVISMQSYQPAAYSSEQISLLETIATQAAIAVQNARLYDQMKQLAITDVVTLLNTRRHFTSLGRREVERAIRYGRSLSVLMVDIDHFKRVNDTYGHNTGDQVLQAVAQLCRLALRATDIVGRWGGEEFAIVLPEADPSDGRLIAERIRRMVEEAAIPTPQGSLKITVSVGVTTLHPECNTLEGLVDLADHALYAAKQSGRNNVKFCVEAVAG